MKEFIGILREIDWAYATYYMSCILAKVFTFVVIIDFIGAIAFFVTIPWLIGSVAWHSLFRLPETIQEAFRK